LAKHDTRKKYGKPVGKSHSLKIGSTQQLSDSECAVFNIRKIPQVPFTCYKLNVWVVKEGKFRPSKILSCYRSG
jgi:hypothetical protein